MDFSGLQLKHRQALQLRDHIVASCPGAQGAQGSMGTALRQGKTCKLMGKSQENMGNPRSGGSWENHRTKWWHFPASHFSGISGAMPGRRCTGKLGPADGGTGMAGPGKMV